MRVMVSVILTGQWAREFHQQLLVKWCMHKTTDRRNFFMRTMRILFRTNEGNACQFGATDQYKIPNDRVLTLSWPSKWPFVSDLLSRSERSVFMRVMTSVIWTGQRHTNFISNTWWSSLFIKRSIDANYADDVNFFLNARAEGVPVRDKWSV